MMNTFLKPHGNTHFHAHPWHTTFSLIASFLLAGLVVLALASSAR